MSAQLTQSNWYEVMFYWSCYGHRKELVDGLMCHISDFSVGMTRKLKIPFIPAVGQQFGFTLTSDFHTDKNKVANVMWLTEHSRFLAQLDHYDCGKSARSVAEFLAEDGWMLDMGVNFECLKDAQNTVEEDEADGLAVERDGSFFALTKAEAGVLEFIEQLKGRPVHKDSDGTWI